MTHWLGIGEHMPDVGDRLTVPAIREGEPPTRLTVSHIQRQPTGAWVAGVDQAGAGRIVWVVDERQAV